jgi:hypothetical protein
VPRTFCCRGQTFASLIACIEQALVHASAAGSKEFKLRFVPKTRVEEVEAAILAPPLCGRQGLPGELDQLGGIGIIVSHRLP